MTILAENALRILKEKRSPKKQRFTENDLMLYGFSDKEAKIVIQELEQNELIKVNRSYVSLIFELA